MSENVRLVDFGYPQTRATGHKELAEELRKLADRIAADESSEIATILLFGMDPDGGVLITRLFTGIDFTRADFVFVLQEQITNAVTPDGKPVFNRDPHAA